MLIVFGGSGFAKEKGISIMQGSAWSFPGEEVLYSSFHLKKFPLGHVLWNSLKAREESPGSHMGQL